VTPPAGTDSSAPPQLDPNVLAAHPQPTTVLPSTQPARHGSSRTHVVQKNETLSSIAAAAYGNSSYYPHILRANPSLDPKRMKPGMTIVLPDVADVKPTDVPGGGTATTASHAAGPINSASQYKVVAGDSLHKISVKLYGKSDMADKLYQLNKEQIGSDPAKLKVGTMLKLPTAPTVASSSR